MRRRGIDRATAEHELRAADLSREAYVRHWYDVEPRDPSLYHLVIDSTAIDLEGCVELMALASKRRGPADSGPVARHPGSATMAGRPGALRRRAPLRTGRASFPASGSSKPCWRLAGRSAGPLPWRQRGV